jgi:hypothetical protein
MNSVSNQDLIAIGIRLGGVSSREDAVAADLESVLLQAAGAMSSDARLASLLFSWVHVHADYVIVEKLRKRIRTAEEDGCVVGITALAAYAVHRGKHKWKKLIVRSEKAAFLSASRAAESAIHLKGSVPWLAEYGVLAAQGSIRVRPEDILSPSELARINLQYRNRLLFGAQWRADIITASWLLLRTGPPRSSGLSDIVAVLIGQITGCDLQPRRGEAPPATIENAFPVVREGVQILASLKVVSWNSLRVTIEVLRDLRRLDLE